MIHTYLSAQDCATKVTVSWLRSPDLKPDLMKGYLTKISPFHKQTTHKSLIIAQFYKLIGCPLDEENVVTVFACEVPRLARLAR